MRCFVKIFNQDETLAFKGTLDLNPGHTSMSQIEVNGARATVEVQARREGDAPDILDELEREAEAVGSKSLLDTIRRMRREFNEIPIQGEVNYLSEEGYILPPDLKPGGLRINGVSASYELREDGTVTFNCGGEFRVERGAKDDE